MPKYIIRTNIGYGDRFQIEEADDFDVAQEIAWELWNDRVQSNADYSAVEATEENCAFFGLRYEPE